MLKALVSFIRSQRGAVIVGLLLTPLVLAAFEWRSQLIPTVQSATQRQPEKYSELYFAEPEHLPKQLNPGEPTSLDFVIVNHEATEFQYHYQVFIAKNDAPGTATTGEVKLNNGQQTHQNVTIPAQKAGEQLQVIIRLPEKNQEIWFRTGVAS